MSISKFRSFVRAGTFTAPDAEWSERWKRRMFEFWGFGADHDADVTRNTLIEFLRAMRDRDVPAWQRHQAAVSASRYQIMPSGTVVGRGHVAPTHRNSPMQQLARLRSRANKWRSAT